jgi:hypothetical protein
MYVELWYLQSFQVCKETYWRVNRSIQVFAWQESVKEIEVVHIERTVLNRFHAFLFILFVFVNDSQILNLSSFVHTFQWPNKPIAFLCWGRSTGSRNPLRLNKLNAWELTALCLWTANSWKGVEEHLLQRVCKKEEKNLLNPTRIF